MRPWFSPSTGPRPTTVVLTVALASFSFGCGSRGRDDGTRLEPRIGHSEDGRAPVAAAPAQAQADRPEPDDQADQPDDQADQEPLPPLPERPPVDPEIERALEVIRHSGLRFISPPAEDEPEAEGTRYTAQEFAAMLSTKWDWIGYDLVSLDPWLDEIATRSFSDDVPYQVELDSGTITDLRGWLDQALLAESKPAGATPGPS